MISPTAIATIGSGGTLAVVAGAEIATDWNPVLMGLVTILGIAVSAFVAWMAAQTKAIHNAVNSSKTILDTAIKDLTAKVLELSTTNATLTQKLAASDLKTQVDAAVAVEQSKQARVAEPPDQFKRPNADRTEQPPPSPPVTS